MTAMTTIAWRRDRWGGWALTVTTPTGADVVYSGPIEAIRRRVGLAEAGWEAEVFARIKAAADAGPAEVVP